MRPCTRVGLDVTWRCNWRCAHCFYLRNPSFHKSLEVDMGETKAKVDTAAAAGLDHAVLVGYGEPSLCPNLLEIVRYCHGKGLATSMITNGATGLRRFHECFDAGMDHLHISSHGLGETLDKVAGHCGAFEQQRELKVWLRRHGHPFRTNVTMQRLNYRELPDLAAYEITMGVYHFVMLGFLPHYEWGRRDGAYTREVAVHPAELRPYIEAAAEKLLEAGTYFTIRYHPLCHLAPHLWKYVVNARYVFYDPWEWNYPLTLKEPDLWHAAVACGESVANHGTCDSCPAFRHCGGWNRVYAAAFDGAGLQPIREVPDEYIDVWGADGGLHDLNPANRLGGSFRAVPN